MLLEENSLRRHTAWEWVLKHVGSFGAQAHVDSAQKVMTLEISHKNHAHNNKNGSKRAKKVWQILLNSHSTCHVIINPSLVQSIWKCK